MRQVMFRRRGRRPTRGERMVARTRELAGRTKPAGAWARSHAGLLAAGSAVAALGGITVARRTAIARRLRMMPGTARGIAYRVAHRTPARDVDDDVLVDRIRSTLGPLEKRLDLPRIHVMVHDGFAVLHGSVGTTPESNEIATAVAKVAGVRGVESHLKVGLTAADTRPSEGRKRMRGVRIGAVRGSKEREAIGG